MPYKFKIIRRTSPSLYEIIDDIEVNASNANEAYLLSNKHILKEYGYPTSENVFPLYHSYPGNRHEEFKHITFPYNNNTITT